MSMHFFKKRHSNQNEQGRSMMEVITVIAVLTILLLAALLGFRQLLNYLHYKDSVKEITDIGMRYKVSNLSRRQQTDPKNVKLTNIFPEGNCFDRNDIELCKTPDGGDVRLVSYGFSTFVVLAKDISPQTCQEALLQDGTYTFAKFFADDITLQLSSIQIVNKDGKSMFCNPSDFRDPHNSQCDINDFCRGGNLLAFVYAGGNNEKCTYFYDGRCHECPENYSKVPAGNKTLTKDGCCKNSDIECGVCGGCKSGHCKDGRCVECENPGESCGVKDESGNCLNLFCSDDYRCVPCGEPGSAHEFFNNGTPKNCNDDKCTCKQPLTCEDKSVCRDAMGVCPCSGNSVCGSDGKCYRKGCDGCEDDSDCPNGEECCKEEGEKVGYCCVKGKCLLKKKTCGNCDENKDCRKNEQCCDIKPLNPLIKPFKTCCSKRFCWDESPWCVNCRYDSDCLETEYCDSGDHECKPCKNQYQKCLSRNVNFDEKQAFSNCRKYTRLDCLNGIKKQEYEEKLPSITKPMCETIGAATAESNDECGPCTNNPQCRELVSKFVCRTVGNHPNDGLGGSCGPCKIDADCDAGEKCNTATGICGGCTDDADCSDRCDGKTKCDTTEHKCVCDSAYFEVKGDRCVCKGAGNAAKDFWRMKDNSYICCAKNYYPYPKGDAYECRPICQDGGKPDRVALIVDYSNSTKVNGLTDKVVKTAKEIIAKVQSINPNVQIGIFREDNTQKTEDKEDGQKCEGVKYGQNGLVRDFAKKYDLPEQNICANDCDNKGNTCFTKAAAKVKTACSENKKTWVFIVSDKNIEGDPLKDTGCAMRVEIDVAEGIKWDEILNQNGCISQADADKITSDIKCEPGSAN